jgi:CheY-like chemotaxis protein
MARVLVVDDEDVLVEMLSSLVEDLGHQPLIAINGREALVSLSGQREPPALIIADVMMPQMNGIEFVKSIRKNPRYGQVPIILTSAAGTPNDTGLADYFVAKPYNLNDLAGIIEQCINAQGLDRF